MPIREIRENEIDRECIKCGTVTPVSLNSIEVGVVKESNVNSKLIALPVCATCGSIEFLMRSPDNEEEHPSQGSYGHKHKLLVDTLHAKLVQKGRIANGLQAKDVKTKEPSQAVKDRWFANGLKLPKSPSTDEKSAGEQ